MLKCVLHKIISPAQTAFFLGRSIHDNIIIAHELIHSMKKTKAKDGYVAIKLDMPKAFDGVERSFLIDNLKKKLFFKRKGAA